MEKRFLILVGTMAFLASFTWAEERLYEFSLTPGIAIPALEEDEDYVQNSFSIDAAVLRRVHRLVQVGLELGYITGAKFEGTVPAREVGDLDGDGIADPIEFNSDIYIRTLHVAPLIKIGPEWDAGSVRWHPYILGGGGYYWTHFSPGVLQVTGITSSGQQLMGSPQAFSGLDSNNGGFNYGAGVSLLFPHGIGLGAELRIHQIIVRQEEDTAYVIPSLRLIKRF